VTLGCCLGIISGDKLVVWHFCETFWWRRLLPLTAWQQHDVQELCRVMFDALERSWKHTDQANLITQLYQGKIKDYVKCLQVCWVFMLLLFLLNMCGRFSILFVSLDTCNNYSFIAYCNHKNNWIYKPREN